MQNIQNDKRSDAELALAVKNNDRDSFKIIYYRYYHQLIRYAWFKLHSMDNAREAVQDLFCAIWFKRHLLNPNKSIKAYLYKSLNNLVINKIKAMASRFESFEESRKIDYLNNELGIESEIDLKTAIEKMPLKLKEVFILSKFEGYKYSEIAEIFGISIKSVEKRFSQIFKYFRKNM